MNVLVLGLVLWVFAHLFKRLAPNARARLGVLPGKLAVTVVSLAALALMVIGYRRAGGDPVYVPLAGMGHLNNLVMLAAVFLAVTPAFRGVLRNRLRHPLLTGTMLWAVAHLLVNGDVASVVLFGGIGLWAVASVVLINAQEPWRRPPAGSLRGDLAALAVATLVYGAIAGIHGWLGYSPFLGSYP